MCKKLNITLLAVVLLGMSVQTSVPGADLTANYIWRPIKIGGAGWETDCWIHPTEPNLVYTKTDVGGCSRWDPVGSKWVQLVTGDSMPEPAGGFFGTTCCGTSYPGVLSIVGAPSNANVAYMFAGCPDKVSPYNGQVFRSTNRGDIWTRPGNLNVFISANDEERTAGPHMAVDPANENVVYVGTQRDGLWVSYDGAATWSKVTAVPVGSTGGVGNVDFDPTSGTTSGRTNKIYASVFGSGVYASVNAGTSWASIGGATNINDMEVGPDGTLYTAGSDARKYSGGSWTTINSNAIDIAVDPMNANHLFVLGSHGGLSAGQLSWDKGANWTGLYRKTTSDIPWQQAYFPEGWTTWMSCGQIVFDPFVANRLWYSEGFGCWRADNVGAQNTVHWHSISQGIEDLCSETLVWPPGGKPLTGGMDLGVFYHGNPDTYTAARVTPTVFLNGWGMDYCPAQPSFVACIQTTALDDYSSYSTDGGKTWTQFSGKPATDGDAPTGLAISATNPDNIVVFSGSQNKAYVTTNRGGNWTSKSFGTPFVMGWGPGDNAIAADRAAGGTFYIYNWSDNADGGIWNTTDGGANWSHVATNSYTPDVTHTLPPTCTCDIEATPGKAGHVWFCGGIIGDNTTWGLYRSTDYGATWSHVTGTDYAQSVGFGKADAGATYPTIFYYGKLNGVTGVWRSTTEAQSWDLICNGGPLGIYTESHVATGDPDQFGKVAISIRGKGFAYGDIIDTTAPAAPTNLTATAVSSSKIDLNWNDNTEPDLVHYGVYRSTTSGGPYNWVANALNSAYTNTGLMAVTTYYYRVTAVDDQDNESGYAQASVTTPAGCSATGTHVSAILVSKEPRGTAGQGGECVGIAKVWIVDTCGDPVANATVYGAFSGAINESYSRTTDSSGYVNFVTAAYARCGSLTDLTFCVDNVTHATLPYAPGDNVVTCCNIAGTCTGPTLPGQATNPNPANGATGVSITADLSWTAGSGATSHDVYFGTAASPPFIQNQTATTYDTGTMANSTTYYWKIDEKNASGTTTGVVWSFTTAAAGPTFVAAGAVASGTGAITPALPSGIAANDILLLSLETANQAISISNQNGGTWTEVTGSPQGTGTASGTDATRLTVFWSRYNGTQGAPTTSDSGNHQLGRMIAVRGAITSGNPWDVTAGGVEATSDTSGSIPGATTTVANTLVVAAIATSLPDAIGTANFSAWANSNLTSVTERTDNTKNAGNGGGLGIATGEKATAGVYGNTTVTAASSAVKGMMSIAIKGG